MTDKMLLDVDDTILTKNLLLSDTSDELEELEIDKVFKQSDTKSRKSITIFPLPGVCIKTKTSSGTKLFINVCTSVKIPPPEDISEEDLISHISMEEPVFAIPLSIGEKRFEYDKSGIPCIIHDVVINKDYFDKCQAKQSFWLFTISVIMESISKKFNISLDPKVYIILKNRKVMGTLKPQRIEDRLARKFPLDIPKPLIEEIPSSSKSVSDNISTPVQLQNNYKESATRNYVVLKEPSKGITERLIGLFQIPAGMSSKDLTVLVGTDRLVVTTNENKFACDACVPYTIKIDETECFFDKDLRVLRLNMPVHHT